MVENQLANFDYLFYRFCGRGYIEYSGSAVAQKIIDLTTINAIIRGLALLGN